MSATITLLDGDEQHARHPETFWMPPLAERQSLQPGDLVKLVFLGEPVPERMWVRVLSGEPEGSYYGTLINTPLGLEGIDYGDEVFFSASHVIDFESAEAGI